jgi:hypothetical protein
MSDGGGDMKEIMTVENQAGNPHVSMPGMRVSDEKLENGSLSLKLTVIQSGWDFTYTLTPTLEGLDVSVLRLTDGNDFSGKAKKE